jgi:hypothetical protein
VQTNVGAHRPHITPHTGSGPHSTAAQSGVQQLPLRQTSAPPQVPHVPPQPSVPHVRPAQLGVQQRDAEHTSAPGHGQSPGQLPQSSRTGVHIESPHTAAQLPLAHEYPAGHAPHEPPQPSVPHVRPLQLGMHPTQTPALQLRPPGQGQSPRQLWQSSIPGAQIPSPQRTAQVPAALHDCPTGQPPHEPPQPSLPHARPAQFGVHEHWPAPSHTCGEAHDPHEVPQTGSGPQLRPLQSGAHAQLPAPLQR